VSIYQQQKSWTRFIPPVLAVLVGIGMFAGMFAFKSFGDYCRAVLTHWVALMSGGVSVIVTFYREIRKSAGKYVLYVVAAMCVFFAGFQAWQEQFKIARELEQKTNRLDDEAKKPKLHGLIDEVVSGYVVPLKGRMLVLRMSITNIGSVTTVANTYVVHLPASCLGTERSEVAAYGGNFAFVMPHGKKASFRREDMLFEKTYTNVIPVGGNVTGWLMFLFPGENKSDLQHCDFAVTFKDVWGQVYESPFRPGPFTNQPTYLPGTSQPFSSDAGKRQ
jgi:hypothetical protein